MFSSRFTNNADEEFSQNAYLSIIFSFILAFLGIAINLYVTILLIRSKLTMSNVYFINFLIMVNDVIADLFLFLSRIPNLATRRPWSPSTCTFMGFVGISLNGVSYFLVVLSVLNPFRIVVLRKSSLRPPQLSIIIITIWILIGFLLPIIPILTNEPYTQFQSRTACLVNFYSGSLSSKISISILAIALSGGTLLTIIAYILIWKHLPRKMAPPRENEMMNVQLRLAKQGVAVSVSLFICWTWPVVFLIYRLLGISQRSEWEDITFGFSAVVATIVNPVVFLLVHSYSDTSASKSKPAPKIVTTSSTLWGTL